MADPFSIVASSLSIADLGIRLVKFLLQVKRGTDSIDEELHRLIGEIQSFTSTSKIIRENFEQDLREGADTPNKDERATTDLWRATGNTLRDGQNLLNKLDTLIQDVVGGSGSSTLDKLRKYFRKQSKNGEFLRLIDQLNRVQELLQILLISVNIIYTRKSQTTSNQSFEQLSSFIEGQGNKLLTRIAALGQRIDTGLHSPSENATLNILAIAGSVTQLASLNVHFMIPQSVSSTFRGRKNTLAALEQAYLSTSHPKHPFEQRRFVIYGLGGSGKTQFCCKFAQDNRQKFWGVFYIDASTPASAKSSYAEIAEKATIEPNERSVNYWLSVQKQPWLLLIDNVNDHSNSRPPETYFPPCETGLVLLTTRNQSLKTQGNFGPRYYEFSGLQEEESVDLLLTSAGLVAPWRAAAVQSATDICIALGFLPLALVQAGKAILKELCTLQNYLTFFENSWFHVRESIKQKSGDTRSGRQRSVSNEAVFSSYEIVVQATSEDAMELLKIFSFMHRQRFHFEVLIRAVLNPQAEKDAERETESSQKDNDKYGSKSWSQIIRDLALRLHGMLARHSERPVLPKLLQSANTSERDEIEFRLREALAELRSIALIDHIEADDSYSMHPLVHWWARERMSLAEQAISCQSACSILAQAILLPPLGSGEKEAELRRQILPHVENVRKQEAEIQRKFLLNQRERRRPWPVLQRKLSSSDIQQYAKFSLVYADSGVWDKAAELLLIVDQYLGDKVGFGNLQAIKARLFLSDAYMFLGEEDRAASVQLELLEACKLTRGEDDPETLNVMNRLGVSFWLQGKFEEAKRCHEKALKKLKNISGAESEETLKVMSLLGNDVRNLAMFDEAVNLHTQALGGLTKDGSQPLHDREVLEVMENLATARLDRHLYGEWQAGELELANKMQMEVVKHREWRLGKEHRQTLGSYCNLALIKAALGATEDAELMIRTRLPIAERNLGKTHISTLHGKASLGHVLMRAGKLSEAEAVLDDVVREHERTRRDHPNQLMAAAFLMECYVRQGKLAEAAPLQEKVMKGVKRIFGDGSPWEDVLNAKAGLQYIDRT